MIGLSLLFFVIGIGAALVGLLACVVGLLITLPAVWMWHQITLVYLYRSWTGQPLVQPPPVAVVPQAGNPPAPPAV
jgi:uncharacterized membrane protein